MFITRHARRAKAPIHTVPGSRDVVTHRHKLFTAVGDAGQIRPRPPWDPVYPVGGGQHGRVEAVGRAHGHKLTVAIGNGAETFIQRHHLRLDPIHAFGGGQDGAFVLHRRVVVPATYRYKQTVAVSDAV